MIKDSYEISVWEDYILDSQPRERRLMVIGSDTMTSDCRAYEPKLVENINGTNTFTFKLYAIYRNDNNEKVPNPFVPYLTNERKVKLKWRNSWYDFIIKNIQEDSTGKSITYTCKDIFISELSKNGYNLVFDADLNNNQGAANELGQIVLEGTTWSIDSNIQPLLEEMEEPVYEATTLTSASWMLNQTNYAKTSEGTTPTNSTIPSGAKILFFYQQIQDIVNSDAWNSDSATGNKNLQFAYASHYITEDASSQLVVNADCFITNHENTLRWTKTTEGNMRLGGDNAWCIIDLSNGVSQNYRAKRLVESQKMIFDPEINRYVSVYKAISGPPSNSPYKGQIRQNDIIYGYQTTEYKDATIVNNLLVNNKGFVSTDGWSPQVERDAGRFFFQLYEENNDFTSLLFLEGRSGNNPYRYYNAGIKESSAFLPEGLVQGSRFIFRIKARSNDQNDTPGEYITALTSDDLNVYIQGLAYDITEDDEPQSGKDYYIYNSAVNRYLKTTVGEEFEENRVYYEQKEYGNYSSQLAPRKSADADGYIEWPILCNRSCSRAQLYENNIQFLFSVPNNSIWIEEVQFFPEVFGEAVSGGQSAQGPRINPGDMDVEAVAAVYYKYYNHTVLQKDAYRAAGDISYLYSDREDWNLDFIQPVLNDNHGFAKIRSITIKESNRYNILQEIAKTFSCWVRFNIKHLDNGEVDYTITNPKLVSFVKDVGQEVGIGFEYGIDLKGITRTIQSDQIVTKTIIPPNSNEFGKDGFCAISRATNNYSRENFILNFEYYVSQGFIDKTTLYNDLYTTKSGSLGYYKNLHSKNGTYDKRAETLAAKNVELVKKQATLTTYTEYKTSIEEEMNNLLGEMYELSGKTSYAEVVAYVRGDGKDYTELVTKLQTYIRLNKTLPIYNSSITKLNASLEKLNTQIAELQNQQNSLLQEITNLHTQFNNKYSRYILEGTWKDDKYIDDELYYLDGLSVAYTSSRPQVSYNISVLRISGLEGFENKIFHLGDISYVIDRDFFGYITVDGVKTPYKEKIMISEITSNLDSPDQDSFKVQNYRTQFEDLFQRITAATQSLQQNQGEYARATGVVEKSGGIKSQVLQETLDKTESLKIKSQNGIISQDSSGYVFTNPIEGNERTMFTAAGAFFSRDGGVTWQTAISSQGINTQALTVGNLSVGKLVIIDGEHQTFKWDSRGINAYDFSYNEFDEITGINEGKFVRFDRFGLYGLNGSDAFAPDTEEMIWDTAQFGLTWRGFFLKNRYGDGWVEISNEEDFRIMRSSDNEVVRIGRLGGEGTEQNPYKYGIRISNNEGNPVFTTEEDGNITITGAISATSGTIGGFQIQDNLLQSTIEEEGAESAALTLYGKTGIIEGNNFSIGGDISYFNNINVSGKISTAVFEIGHVQSVGGMMIFKDAYKIKTVSSPTYYFTYDTEIDVNKTYYIKDGQNYQEASSLTTLYAITLDDSPQIGKKYYVYVATYFQTTDIEKQVEKTYYILDNETDVYEEFTGESFQEGVAYYEKMFIYENFENETFEQGVNYYDIPYYEYNENEYIELVLDENCPSKPIASTYCFLINNTGEISSNIGQIINSDETSRVCLNIVKDANEPVSLVVIGSDGAGIIGVNSNEQEVLVNNSTILYPRALTLTTFNESNLSFDERLVLGDLSGTGYSGYGLYADNVYLHGSLITEILPDHNYAGINTINGATASVFTPDKGLDLDESRIVFWAGAESIDDIKKAPFQVTENGSFYARQGLFEGSIFVDATITAATLEAAEIRGTSGTPSLRIFDVADNENGTGGIGFYTTVTTNNVTEDIQKLLINSKGFKFLNSNFIQFSEDNNITNTVFNGTQLNLSSDLNINSANFSFDSTSDRLNIKLNNNNKVEIANDKTIFSNSIQINDNMELSNKMSYLEVSNGYDLYVS